MANDEEDVIWISYPRDGTKKRGSTGTWTFNFRNGKVTLPAGTTENMSGKLGDFPGADWIRSIFFYAPSATGIMRIEPSGAAFELDQCAVHIIKNIKLDKFVLSLSGPNIPDELGLTMVASTGNVGYEPQFAIFHDEGIRTTGTSADAYGVILEKHMPSFIKNTYIFTNEGATNSIDIDIQHRETSTATWRSRATFPQAIAAGDTVFYTIEESHHFTRIRIRSTTAGSSSTYELQWMAASL